LVAERRINRVLLARRQHVLDDVAALIASAKLRATAPKARVLTVAGTKLPSGTVTFLFTDLVDSTLFWEQQPDAMRHAVARHDETLAAAVTGHGGFIVKFQGDGLMAVFDDADAAVRAAVDGQREMRNASGTLSLGVRMGLCTGSVRERDGDYHGPIVNRAARIASSSHPGQIVVAPTTAALVESFAQRDIGEYQLKGLPVMRLSQIVADGIDVDFPPLAATQVGFDLVPATSFVGRTRELESVRQFASEHPFVTLTGSGGCGKTRLALEAARLMADQFPDGVRFADLAVVTEPEGVAAAVTQALGLVDDDGLTDPIERISAHLRRRAMLCIVDNCEHLLDACAVLAAAVITRPGTSRLLATSREPLGVPGEQVVLVPSLDARSDALHLFAARAAEARAGFTLDNATTETVAQICERLDGIPLAVELAAARVSQLAPAQLLERLTNRFDVLTGGRRRVPRQQTLSATLDWSHDLLDQPERESLRRLAVFPGGFSLEAANDVSGADDDSLGSLVAKSLVQVVDDGDRFRYRLLETVRAYANEKLAAAGEADKLRARHAQWVADSLESVELLARWFGDDAGFVDLGDVRAALEWSTRNGSPEVTARIASGVNWNRYDQWREGLRWCEAAIESDALDAFTRLQVLIMLQLSRMSDLSSRAFELAEESESVAEGLDDPLVALMWVLRWSPTIAEVTGDAALAAAAAECFEIGVAMGDSLSRPWQIYLRLMAAMGYTIMRQYEVARRHLEVAVAVGEAVEGYDSLVGAVRGVLSLRCVLDGDLERARVLIEGVVDVPHLSAEIRQGPMAAVVTRAAIGDVAGARHQLRTYYEDCLDSDLPLGAESMLVYAAAAASVAGNWEDAARVFGASGHGFRRSPDAYMLYLTLRERMREALGVDRARQLRDEGRSMSREAAVALALTDA
jgi:predicted ATPase/class 3 adenylate cyclase